MGRGTEMIVFGAFIFALVVGLVMVMIMYTGESDNVERVHTKILHLSSVRETSVIANILGSSVEVGGREVPAHYVASQCLVGQPDDDTYCLALQDLLDKTYGVERYVVRLKDESGKTFQMGKLEESAFVEKALVYSASPSVGRISVEIYQ